jgi:thiamine pyrophosphokinase
VTGARTVVVFTGGEAPPSAVLEILDSLDEDAFVVAADSGLDHARGLGRRVDLVVGDMDSVSEAALVDAETAGVPLDRHDPDKDQTDLALALDTAVARGARRIVVVGGHGGRLDHLLANALLLAAPEYAAAIVDAYMGSARVHVVRGERRLPATPGESCTLLPVHGGAEGVWTHGLRWTLRDEPLEAGTSRGVSNVAEDGSVVVSVGAGALLVVFPGTVS